MHVSPYDPGFDDCGFDISHWNVTLDFRQLFNPQGGKRRACFLKLTEGTSFIDPKFSDYVQRLIDTNNDKCLCVYHFAHAANPQGQIQFFLNTFIDKISKYQTPPNFLFLLDVERSANPPTQQDAIVMVNELAYYNINPIIYCGYDFFSVAWQELINCYSMIAEYGTRPISAIPWRIPSATVFGWDWWQYSGSGEGPFYRQISGGDPDMDLSCFNAQKNGIMENWWSTALSQTIQPR